MRRAIELATQHRTHPNPRVGAVIVDQAGNVVGEGAHEGVGQPHAEVVALGQAGAQARGSTLYVTLEPCSHYGNTPPCVTAIVTAGISRVVVGAIDPDERVSGKGVSWLTDARIEVVLEEAAADAEVRGPGLFPSPTHRAPSGHLEDRDDPRRLGSGPRRLVAMDQL